MELDAVAILAEPAHAFLLELVTGRIVDDEEDLATVVTLHELPQELEERDPIEHVGEAERELGSVERNRTEDVRGPARPVGVDARLNPTRDQVRYRLPSCQKLASSSKTTTPRHRAAALRIAGRRLVSHSSWAALSARASRFRGRWTEKSS
jgi:hypothetical protein